MGILDALAFARSHYLTMEIILTELAQFLDKLFQETALNNKAIARNPVMDSDLARVKVNAREKPVAEPFCHSLQWAIGIQVWRHPSKEASNSRKLDYESIDLAKGNDDNTDSCILRSGCIQYVSTALFRQLEEQVSCSYDQVGRAQPRELASSGLRGLGITTDGWLRNFDCREFVKGRPSGVDF